VDHDGQSLRLEPRSMDLLVFLAEHAGEVVTRDAIIRVVWKNTAVGDEVISRAIYLIRKNLSGAGRESKALIDTIPKRGYRLCAPVSPIEIIQADEPPKVEAVAPPPPMPGAVPPRHRPGRLAAGVLAGLVLAATAVWLIAREASDRHVLAKGADRLLILPFTRVDSDQPPYLANQLWEELISGLGALPQVRVVGKTTSSHLAPSHPSPDTLRRDLQVGAVVEAQLRGDERDFSLSLRVTNTGTGRPLLVREYSGNTASLATVDRQVLDDVLLVTAGRGAMMSAPQPAALKPETLRLYMQGRYYAGQNNPGAFQQAIDYFDQAVNSDPSFARGWAALAVSTMLTVDFGNRSVAEVTPRASQAAQNALRLDPASSDGYAAAGLVALYNHRYSEAAEALRRATALSPSDAHTHMWLGRVFMAQNDMARAGASFERAFLLEPQSAMIGLNLALSWDQQGRHEDALKVIDDMLKVAPDLANLYWAKARLEGEEGHDDMALKAYQNAIRLGAEYSALYAGYSIELADLGEPDEALAALAHGESLVADDPTIWAAKVNYSIATRSLRDWPEVTHGATQVSPFWHDLAAAKLALMRGETERAISLYEKAKVGDATRYTELSKESDVLGGPGAYLDLACAYQASGQSVKAESMLALAGKMLADDHDLGIGTPAYHYLNAALTALRGDDTRAIALLRFAKSRGWHRYFWLKVDPRFAHLQHRDQLFADFMQTARR
jgi:DNA-binding winged helix-turn-helix (wHTH) protein/tetratricopeptide (TPR) repeat protein/TolB-like protein